MLRIDYESASQFLLEKDNKVTHAKNLISYEEFITASVVSHYSVDIL